MEHPLKTDDFDYHLPDELIAQTPLEARDQSRLMVVKRGGGQLEHRRFYEIMDYLREGDNLVFNDSRVIPARLAGRRKSGGRLELLLLRRLDGGLWEALARPARRIRAGSRLELGETATLGAEVTQEREGGVRVLRFSDEALLPSLGRVPLPPYIRAPLKDPERYQTVYANTAGSVAAPTAGLHFTPELIAAIEAKGVECHFVTLHVGLDTFLPVREEDPAEHRIHREYGVVSREVAASLSRAKWEGRRVISVGTTTTRLLEAIAQAGDPGELGPFAGWVDLFILPGHRFRMVDALITNFHLPRSTLIMLVSAFAGRELMLRAYQEAIAWRYRFYSFGDAMFIV
jgi:S-adenosylmethionine:tRNA ribosyltransferase-isomerase